MSPSVGLPRPPDSKTLNPLTTVWAAGRRIRRCHSSEFGAAEFNPRARTPGRFRPIRVGRRIVPSLYGAGGGNGAISETVFHDVPIGASTKQVRMGRFDAVLLSTIAPKRDLNLIQLHGHRFQRLNVSRRDLIESDASSYGALAEWGQALYDCQEAADGLVWRSRLYDDDYAMLLFGTRVSRRDLEVVAPSLPLALGRGLELVQAAAETAGIALII